MAAKNEIRKREMLGQLLWGLGTAAAEIVAQLAMDPEHFEIGLALLHSNINRRARSAFESGGPKSKENESEVYARMREELKGEK